MGDAVLELGLPKGRMQAEVLKLMSAAVSTEMPMSAARNAGESLIPSPMNPTT